MSLEITVRREPYVGNIHEVDLYLPDGTVRGKLLTPAEIADLIRWAERPCFIHFVGGGRPTRTFYRRKDTPTGGQK